MKSSLVDKVAALFMDAGYQVVSCRGTQSSFDVLAKGRKGLFLIKVLSNIEGLTSRCSQDLRSVSVMLDAAPIVVGERIKSSVLSEGVVYERYGVNVVCFETLGRILDDEVPSTHTVRGNYCLKINSRVLSRLRRERGLTQEDLADVLGVSKQSVYRYECGGRVSSSIAAKLGEVFRSVDDLFLPSDVFSASSFFGDEAFEGYVSDLKRRALESFKAMGFEASLTNAPFDIVLREHEAVFSAVSNDWRRLEQKVSVIEEISDACGAKSVCVTERHVDVSGCVLNPEELKEIKTVKEFIKIIS